MTRSGTWWLESVSDSRWNFSQHGDCVGGFVMPNECLQKIEEFKLKFGELPKDLEWGYMKD